MKIKPVGDRLLIKPENPQKKSENKLLLTKLEDEKQDKGIIVAIGDGMEVKNLQEGDKIIYQKYGPTDITIEKEKYVIVHLDEVLAKEEK